jgi:hypothetical protein
MPVFSEPKPPKADKGDGPRGRGNGNGKKGD